MPTRILLLSVLMADGHGRLGSSIGSCRDRVLRKRDPPPAGGALPGMPRTPAAARRPASGFSRVSASGWPVGTGGGAGPSGAEPPDSVGEGFRGPANASHRTSVGEPDRRPGAVGSRRRRLARAPGGPQQTAERPSRVVARSPADGELAAGLQVWLKADAIQLKEEERLKSWQDAGGRGNHWRVSAEEGLSGEAAAPEWIPESRVHGKPALRFDGQSRLEGPDSLLSREGRNHPGPFLRWPALNRRTRVAKRRGASPHPATTAPGLSPGPAVPGPPTAPFAITSTERSRTVLRRSNPC